MNKQESTLLAASLGQKDRFVLQLDIGNLRVTHVVRRLPNRRVVMRGLMDGREVFIKAFLGKGAERYAMRDMQGAKLFQQANVLTPALHHYEKSDRYQAWILVFEAVKQAMSASDYFSAQTQSKRLILLQQISFTLGQHHQAGLLQHDMHPSNFLVQTFSRGIKVYSLDGDGVSHQRQLGDTQCMHNLATLLCKFDVLQVNQHISVCLQSYAQARGWNPFSDNQLKEFIGLMRRIRLDMLSQYAGKKVFRNCTDVSVIKKSSFVMRLSNHFPVNDANISMSLHHAFSQANFLKQGNTCTIVRYRLNNIEVVIKRYNIKNFWHAISRGLRSSRAAFSWSNAHRLKLLGIPTGQPVALVEKRRLGWQMQAYFIASFVDGVSLRELPTQANKLEIKRAAEALAALFYRLHLIGLSHGDCKSDNFKYDQQCWWILDLDSMQQHSSEKRASQAHIRDLKRLFANWKADDTLYNVMLSAFAKRYGNDPVLRMAGLQ